MMLEPFTDRHRLHAAFRATSGAADTKRRRHQHTCIRHMLAGMQLLAAASAALSERGQHCRVAAEAD